MNYYRNAELADLYGVSKRAISNWLASARRGRLALELYEEDGKYYIVKTSKNQTIMSDLVQDRRKFLNKRSRTAVTPLPEFERLYTQAQILDIITNIDIHREIPRQYNYFDGGADFWDKYSQRLFREDAPSLIKSTIGLLGANMNYLDTLLASHKRVNVIDVGVGNALPTRGLLTHLLKTKKLGRYVAIDISEEMLGIAERNIKEWFGGQVPFEHHVRDISYERFADVLLDDVAQPEDSINLVLLLGGTLANFRVPEDVVKVISNSMGRHDLFLYTVKLDSEVTRRQLDFRIADEKQPLPPQYKFIVDLLGIDEPSYDVDMGYDEQAQARFIRIKLRKTLDMTFKLNKGSRRIELPKEEQILLWRSWQQLAPAVTTLLEANGFKTLHMSKTRDHDYMLTICDIRTDGR